MPISLAVAPQPITDITKLLTPSLSAVPIVAALLMATIVPARAAMAQTTPTATSSPVALLTDSARLAIESAYAAGRPEAVVAARMVAERGLEQHPADALLMHYQAYAFFREAQLRGPEAARPLFENARTAIERSLAARDLPESRAVLSATLGNLIGGSPFRAIRFGRASFAEIDKAVALGPDNPRVWMLKGVGQLFAPSVFGGGVDKAEASLRKAVAQFATDRPVPPFPAWGRAETHGWLAIALARQKRGLEARAELDRGLAIEPQHAFLLSRATPAVDSASPSPAP